ncbi:MAG: tetratricopeptide repeat protein [Nitrospirota bacterium]
MTAQTHFGKYLLIDKVGTGGMAELFMAKQTGMKGFEKVMAIKRILPHLTEDAEFVSMFINEAKLAALLTHQNIVQIFDLGHIENSFFIAMEYVMGKDLRTILQRAKTLNHPLSVGHALLIMSKVCAGMDYAHRKKDLTGRDLNLVHRDISPQNILVSYEGEVKLVDFGIAKAASQAAETRTGILKGKLSYMAPEQARGRPVDRRTDIFAIGIVLYEILTGHKLFTGDNDFDTLEKVREAKVEPPPTSLNKQVAPELEAILLKALAKEPENRYASASEMQTALEDHMSQKGHDFSTVRLAQYLQNLFQHDIEQDSQRFQIAVGATVAVTDQSTVVRRPAPASESTPSRPSRRLPTPVPARKPAGPSVVRLMILTAMLMMLSVTLLSMINPPFLASLSDSYPKVHTAVVRLSQWPLHTLEWTSAALNNTAPPPASPEASPGPIETAPAFLEPVFQEPTIVPTEITEEPDRKLTPQEKEEVRTLLRDAKTAYNERRLDDVERMLRRIIDLNPKVPVVYHLLGTVTMERKDPDRALRIFEEATRKFPDYPLLHYDLGFLYFKQGVVSLANDEFKKALALDPNAPMAERARAVLQEIGRPAGRQEIRPVASPDTKPESSESEP